MVFTLGGFWVSTKLGGGSTKELVHNLHMHFVTLGISKMEVFQTFFLDVAITQHDHPTY